MSEELKKCAACGMKIPVDAQICPYCRSLQPQQEKRSSSGCLNIIGGIVLTLIILAAIGSICSSPESDTPLMQQPAKTDANVQQSATTNPKTPTTQAQPAVPSSSSAKIPSKQSTAPKPSGSSTTIEISTTTKDEKATMPQETKDKENTETISGEALEQGKQEFEQQKIKGRIDKQTKRQERKQERQAKKNNKQAEQDKAE